GPPASPTSPRAPLGADVPSPPSDGRRRTARRRLHARAARRRGARRGRRAAGDGRPRSGGTTGLRPGAGRDASAPEGDAAAGRRTDVLPRPTRGGLLRQPGRRRARRARHRHPGPGRAKAQARGQELRAQVTAGAALPRAHRDGRGGLARRRRQVPHPGTGEDDRPLPARGAQGRRRAPARRAARARDVSRGGAPAEEVARAARRRPRPGSRVAHPARAGPRERDRLGQRPGGQRREHRPRGARARAQPAREALRHPPVHERHGGRQGEGQDPQGPGDGLQRRRLRRSGQQDLEVPRVHEVHAEGRPRRLQGVLPRGHQPDASRGGHGASAAAGHHRVRV
ncbi:MAG: hypothetical protein AVDCRST_MAG53-2587, partial [uncultured Solirubrobacteraceae bacterium]